MAVSETNKVGIELHPSDSGFDMYIVTDDGRGLWLLDGNRGFHLDKKTAVALMKFLGNPEVEERRYQIVLDDGQFFYVVATDRRTAYDEAVQLVHNCEIHDKGDA